MWCIQCVASLRQARVQTNWQGVMHTGYSLTILQHLYQVHRMLRGWERVESLDKESASNN